MVWYGVHVTPREEIFRGARWCRSSARPEGAGIGGVIGGGGEGE
jgi:hypothetical protein